MHLMFLKNSNKGETGRILLAFIPPRGSERFYFYLLRSNHILTYITNFKIAYVQNLLTMPKNILIFHQKY